MELERALARLGEALAADPAVSDETRAAASALTDAAHAAADAWALQVAAVGGQTVTE